MRLEGCLTEPFSLDDFLGRRRLVTECRAILAAQRPRWSPCPIASSGSSWLGVSAAGNRRADAEPGRARGRNRAGRPSWALRREYRSTFRDKPTSSEKIVKGKWFSEAALKSHQDTGEGSMAQDVAE